MSAAGRVAVVGGGIAGLAAARELAAEGAEVVVHEAAGRLGGKIETTDVDGRPVDAGADAFLAGVPHAVELCRSLGIEGELVSPATGSASLWLHGRLRPLPDGLVLGVPTRFGPVAASGILSLAGLARVAAEPGLPGEPLHDGEDEAVGALVRRRFGPEVHERLHESIFPGIEAAPNAPEGVIEHVKPEALSDVVKPGDLVLCRTTAPLIETCLSLLREGIRAKVRGRDIGKNFVDLVNKLRKQYPALNIENFNEKLDEWRNQQAMLIGLSEDAEMKLAALDDKIDTMHALFEAYVNEHKDTASFDGFQIYIESFFSEELGPTVILGLLLR